MLDDQLFDNIECAIPHGCAKKKDISKKCAQCEIGYKFITIEPITLACGHYICNGCTQKVQKGSIKCKICENIMVNLNAPGSASEYLILSNMPKLFEELRDKYVEALGVINGIYLFFLFSFKRYFSS